MERRMLIAGNWKMNGLQSARKEAAALIALQGGNMPGQFDVLICPPATLLADMARDAGSSGLYLGGQDCHSEDHGAHTGDIAAAMLKDAGAGYVIVGHSERRTDYGEGDAQVKAKAEAALVAGLIAIVCVGETLAEREAGQAFAVVGKQVEGSLPVGASAKNCVLAYEPVWAIGTGKVATLEDIASMHAHIRGKLKTAGGAALAAARILYGGSVKPSNAEQIFSMEDVDGGLIGGASLQATDFSAIIDVSKSL
ncbi:MAG: triose-phosphate isomerase [Robiginitomaculum sp.]|nr:MAG: triose-phosphate isomerase [Robiginitomaculum sp.]